MMTNNNYAEDKNFMEIVSDMFIEVWKRGFCSDGNPYKKYMGTIDFYCELIVDSESFEIEKMNDIITMHKKGDYLNMISFLGLNTFLTYIYNESEEISIERIIKLDRVKPLKDIDVIDSSINKIYGYGLEEYDMYIEWTPDNKIKGYYIEGDNVRFYGKKSHTVFKQAMRYSRKNNK